MFQQLAQCPQCKTGSLKPRKGKFGEFFGCSNYPECKYTFTEKKGGFPEPSPELLNGPTKPLDNKNGISILADEFVALRGVILTKEHFDERMDKFAEYLKSKFE